MTPGAHLVSVEGHLLTSDESDRKQTASEILNYSRHSRTKCRVSLHESVHHYFATSAIKNLNAALSLSDFRYNVFFCQSNIHTPLEPIPIV